MKVTDRRRHEQWLKELTSIPTAAGKEHRIIAWVKQWVKQRRDLQWREDRVGNLVITQREPRPSRFGRGRGAPRPLFITAHLDHPAFVVQNIGDHGSIELEFRGGVNDPYFPGAEIDIFDSRDRTHRAEIISLDSAAQPFKRIYARLEKKSRRDATPAIRTGDVGRWVFHDHAKLPRVSDGMLHTHGCDDMAAIAAALAALDELRRQRHAKHVRLLFTRAEEIGFIGAIAACKLKTVPKNARLICLENSRSYPESPIGAGPIVRVGDKSSVFGPTLTNDISLLMAEHQKLHPAFKWQRKLMPGGTCEATTFTTYGYESTCLCLPLGNYHNMIDIDGVAKGKRPAKVGPEFISIDDYHGLIDMLIICATQLGTSDTPSLKQRMEQLYAKYQDVL